MTNLFYLKIDLLGNVKIKSKTKHPQVITVYFTYHV